MSPLYHLVTRQKAVAAEEEADAAAEPSRFSMSSEGMAITWGFALLILAGIIGVFGILWFFWGRKRYMLFVKRSKWNEMEAQVTALAAQAKPAT